MIGNTFGRTCQLALVGVLAFGGATLVATQADAQAFERHRSGGFSGPRVESSRQADIFRSPTAATVTRQGEVNNKPWSSSRSRASTRTNDGYISSVTRVGPTGATQSRTRDVAVSDGSYSRTATAATSNGRGYDYDVTAINSGDAVTVTRSLTTSGGGVRSGTVTRPY